MKLVKEHIIFEKFSEDSDPIHDMGIGNDFVKIKKGDIIKTIKRVPKTKYNVLIFNNNSNIISTGLYNIGLFGDVWHHSFENNELYLQLIFVPDIKSARNTQDLMLKGVLSSERYIYTYGTASIGEWDEYFEVLK